ncbi:unnamed protein product [Penicillium pancosmium]
MDEDITLTLNRPVTGTMQTKLSSLLGSSAQKFIVASMIDNRVNMNYRPPHDNGPPYRVMGNGDLSCGNLKINWSAVNFGSWKAPPYNVINLKRGTSPRTLAMAEVVEHLPQPGAGLEDPTDDLEAAGLRQEKVLHPKAT